ncbi:uncharacterized protein VTP21DRAFT_2895 [Calcarisporiella thermophila]|uniref:uncharacterized protein n=1 Tax=Calcarisporiella thermophila TaxID=911321 RepID=UPI0037433B9C
MSAEAVATATQSGMIDAMDVILLGTIGVGTLVYFFRDTLFSFVRKSDDSKSHSANGVSKPNGVNGVDAAANIAARKKSRDFVAKMREMDRNVILFFGSQTGTAEDYAARLAKEGAQKYGLRTMTANLEDYDITNLDQLPEGSLAFFVMATYGEGEPTDNALDFWELITSEMPEFSQSDAAEDPEKPLSGLRYVVFGLGNRTYEHYNAVARTVDARLEQLGAKRVGERGEGDDDGSLEEDFLAWKEDMWKEVCQAMNVSELAAGERQASYTVTELTTDDMANQHVYEGELAEKSAAAPATKISYDAKHPYAAPISTMNVFTETADRHCIHGEVDIRGSGLRYEAGDHIAVWPTNSDDEVERLARVLGMSDKLDTAVMVRSTDPTTTKPHPFPVPASYRTIFRHYVDICGLPSRQALASLAPYAPNEKAKEDLAKIGNDKEEYARQVSDRALTLGEVLEMISPQEPFSSIPFDLLIENLPRLQCRYYSISSSPKVHPDHIHLTAVVLTYQPEPEAKRTVYGVATNYLLALHRTTLPDQELANSIACPRYHVSGPRGAYAEGGLRVPIHVRRSNFKLPRNPRLPVVMIGPGTGVAPFRGFVQERAKIAQQGQEVGETILFYGCRRSDEDFLYRDEWPGYFEALGPKSKMITAFSREGAQKVYVQHRLKEHAEQVWELIYKKQGYFYVCGDAKNMAHDVQHTLIAIAQQYGGMDEARATSWVKDLRSRGRYQEDVWS